ncbi:hypothetical protein [Leptolyngbya sp. FACHB-261]|uniref:hypothetical protein n=1 Tax=Leptolyngbya sp. FACHB-261 TaxID=2692806 RepID=UPI0016868931|nr:hypothetical protein [Leptolyngbya sp. FACHB-261]MBD2099494.1 hypothetical protein [Leptolyngbya sp. FACHB-261]
MAGWKFPFFNFAGRKAQNSPGSNTPPQSPPPATPPQAAPLSPPVMSVTALQRKMEEEERQLYSYPLNRSAKPPGIRKAFNKVVWIAVLLGIPVGLVWLANLPYPMVRRPVAASAPILLLPSYMSMEDNYKQAIASVEQADQLISNATSPADLDLGQQKVEQAQEHLDALPLDFLNAWPEYSYWWYGWRFSNSRFNWTRARVAQLKAQVFQEKNAQNLLLTSDQAVKSAKQQYEQAATPTDKRLAVGAWRSALEQLEEVPGQTLAGKTAQQKLDAYQRDFQEVVGLAAGSERVGTLISAAQEFSWQAAKAGQNPPHTVAEWEQVRGLWQQAIESLDQISSDDLAGYAEAQRLIARYKTDLGQVEVRLQEEQESVQALDRANDRIEQLLAKTPTDPNSVDSNLVISQLQGIINDLDKVSSGTTSYLKAQELLLSAKNKLKQLQSQ